jgi:hypothetical protein
MYGVTRGSHLMPFMLRYSKTRRAGRTDRTTRTTHLFFPIVRSHPAPPSPYLYFIFMLLYFIGGRSALDFSRAFAFPPFRSLVFLHHIPHITN